MRQVDQPIISPSIANTLAALAAATCLSVILAGTSDAVAAPTATLPRIATPTAAQLAKGSYGCGWAHLGALRQWQQRIAEARTVSEARELAAGPVRTARHALGVARIANPWSASLAKADTRLSEFERGVETSPTAADVAARFGGLVKIDPSGKDPVMLADLQVANVKVDGPGGCRYSTGEIVAIVIGFILFIIPGIILLVVLC